MPSKQLSTYPYFSVLWRLVAACCLMLALTGNAHAEKINLNTADADTLTYIPGIGPAKAREIVSTREAIGDFQSMEDLLSVKGIGEKTLEVIRQHGELDGGVSTLTEEMRSNPPRRAASTQTSDAPSG